MITFAFQEPLRWKQTTDKLAPPSVNQAQKSDEKLKKIECF